MQFHSAFSGGNPRGLCIPASNLNALIPSRLVRLNTVSKFGKINRKSLYCVFALHKGHFHVVVMQWRQRNIKQSVVHVQSCCLTYCFFRQKRRFPNVLLRKIFIHEHWTRVTRVYEFPLSVHTASCLGFSPTRSYGASEREAWERYPASTVLGHHTRALSVDTTFNTLWIFCFPNREIKYSRKVASKFSKNLVRVNISS